MVWSQLVPRGSTAVRTGASLVVLGVAPLAIVALAIVAGAGSASAATAPVLTTVAGTGTNVRGLGGPALNAKFGPLQGVAVDAADNVYVASPFDNVVGEIDAPTNPLLAMPAASLFSTGTGQLTWSAPLGVSSGVPGATVIAGTTAAGVSAIHWTQSTAQPGTWIQTKPSTLAVGTSYRATVLVQGTGTVALDLAIGTTDTVGAPVTLTPAPQAIAVGVVGATGTPELEIRTAAAGPVDVLASAASLTPVSSATRLVAGDLDHSGYAGDGGPAAAASLYGPGGVAVAPDGSVFIADTSNDVVRKVTPEGTITTVAGTGTAGYSGDGGKATAATLWSPTGLAVTAAGNLLIADSYNNAIRMVTPAGIISTVAGTGDAGFFGDGGKATAAQLANPEGLALDRAGNLYIADTSNSAIRRVSPDGVIRTVAGTGDPGFSGDAGKATAAALQYPMGVAADSAGDVFVADTRNFRIREIDTSGTISTVAGNGSTSAAVNGPALSSGFKTPEGVAVTSTGVLYVVDETGGVRMITGVAGAVPAGSLPEAPFVALLPVAGLGAAVLVFSSRRRRPAVRVS